MNFKHSAFLRPPMTPIKFVNSKKEIVKYSFIVQKTITYLDLSLCEFSSFKSQIPLHAGNFRYWSAAEINVVLTEEAFRKNFFPDRKVLYKYHLDVSNELELSFRNANDKQNRPFYSCTILINKIVLKTDKYKTYFNQILTDALINSNQKVEFIQKISRMAKSMKFILKNKYIHDNGLNVLYFLRADSSVVVDFLSTIKFKDGHFLSLFLEVFEYVLEKSNQERYNLWTPSQSEMINASIYYRMFVKAMILLQYRDAPRFCFELYNELKRSTGSYGLLEEGFDCPVENGLITKERHFLILQIFEVFCASRFSGLEALQMVWRTIPDTFITMADLNYVFKEQQNPEFIKQFCSYIEIITGEEIDEEIIWEPRNLKHYCRIVIRRTLSNNFQLKTGIALLNLPPKLEDFIRLAS